jgi:coenzyme F420-reducing hydrogenase beta subunit
MYFKTNIKEECCGCKACGAVCPVKAISFSIDVEGFWYPEIDKSLCIHCGKCEIVCPCSNTFLTTLEDTNQTFACYANDLKVLEKSTSGGMFSLFSDAILAKSGVIYGCKYDSEMHAVHDFADDRKGRDAFCGSKYVQSDTKGVFLKVKEKLESGKEVLFTGTPCQVLGLKQYLTRDYEGLFTLDMVCHGVPSPKIFSEYIALLEKKNNEKIEDFKFRGKNYGWSKPTKTIFYSSGKIEQTLLSIDPYNYLYLGTDIIVRPSCFSCKFAGTKRVSDISIADFWGIQEEFPEMVNDNHGVSVLMINSDKGKKLLSVIDPSLYTIKQVPLSSVQRKNQPLNKPMTPYWDRDKFFLDYQRKGLEFCIRHYCVSTFWAKIKNKVKRKIRQILSVPGRTSTFSTSTGIRMSPERIDQEVSSKPESDQ